MADAARLPTTAPAVTATAAAAAPPPPPGSPARRAEGSVAATAGGQIASGRQQGLGTLAALECSTKSAQGKNPVLLGSVSNAHVPTWSTWKGGFKSTVSGETPPFDTDDIPQQNPVVMAWDAEHRAAEPGGLCSAALDCGKALTTIALTPCLLWRFLRQYHERFGGFITMTILQHGLNLGLGGSLLVAAQRRYLVEVLQLGADPRMLQTVTAASRIPWHLQPALGLLSDVLPLFGFHRTSYIVLAGALGVLACLSLDLLPAPVAAAALFFVFANLARVFPGVAVEAEAARLSKTSPERATGLQSLSCVAFVLGIAVACAVSGALQDAVSPRTAVLTIALCPLSILVVGVLRWMPEDRLPVEQRKFAYSTISKHWELAVLAICISVISVALSLLQLTVQDARIRGATVVASSVVMTFCIYVCLHRTRPMLANVAVLVFLRECLQPKFVGDVLFIVKLSDPGQHLGPKELGMLEGTGALGLLVGVTLYNRCLASVPYRQLFAWVQVAVAASSLADFVLFFRLNVAMGISDLDFAAFVGALTQMFSMLSTIPLSVLCAKVCPDNLEATVWAMLMALASFGISVGESFGSALGDALGLEGGKAAEVLPAVVAVKSLCLLLPIPLILYLVPGDLTPGDPVSKIPGCGSVGVVPPPPMIHTVVGRVIPPPPTETQAIGRYSRRRDAGV